MEIWLVNSRRGANSVVSGASEDGVTSDYLSMTLTLSLQLFDCPVFALFLVVLNKAYKYSWLKLYIPSTTMAHQASES